MKQQNTVAILAGGSGQRAGGEIPKQLVDMAGMTLLERTVEVFERHPRIDCIVVVSHPDLIGQVEAIRAKHPGGKWQLTVAGGAERQWSTAAAVQACPQEGNLLIHDAARPFVPAALIDRLLDALETHAAAVPAVPVSDTLIEVTEGCVKCVPNRANFRFVQTPQAFHLDLFHQAITQLKSCKNLGFTDDCGLFRHFFPQTDIAWVDGDIGNKKLTYPSDIEEFRKIFQQNDKNKLQE